MGLELRKWDVKRTVCTDRHSAWFDGDVQVSAWNGLTYDTSWDSFMEVYRKAKDYLHNMERPSRNHCCKGDMIEVDVHCAVVDFDLKKAFNALVEVVKWIQEYESKKS